MTARCTAEDETPARTCCRCVVAHRLRVKLAAPVRAALTDGTEGPALCRLFSSLSAF